MILRVWRAPVEADDVDGFTQFMRLTLAPALQSTPGFVSMTTAVDRSQDPPTVVAVSTWDSVDAIEELTGPDEGVVFEEAKTYLAGEPTVDHHEVLDHWTPSV